MSAKVIPVRWLDSFCHAVYLLHSFRDGEGYEATQMHIKQTYQVYGMLESAEILGYLTQNQYARCLALANDPPLLKTEMGIARKIVEIFHGVIATQVQGVHFQRVKRCS